MDLTLETLDLANNERDAKERLRKRKNMTFYWPRSSEASRVKKKKKRLGRRGKKSIETVKGDIFIRRKPY